MPTINKVLKLLLDSSNEPLSGPVMAEKIEVSRNAIWKAIHQLKKEGYEIEAQSQKGYKLQSFSTDLDAKLIKALLPSSFNHWQVESYNSVSSTNDVIRSRLIDSPSTPLLIASQHQTQGRGRRGRTFYSELEEGLYFSIGFKPKNLSYEEMPIYSIIAVTAIVQALEKYLDSEMDIKWVNDIFYKGKKVSGILSEVVADLESGGIPNIIIGIGLNLAGSFEEADHDVQQIAGSIFEKGVPDFFNPNMLLKDFLILFSQYEADLRNKTFLPEYKNRLLGLNKEVYYSENGEDKRGVIRGLDDKGQLIVETPTGKRERLIGQEIHFSSHQFLKK